MKKEEIKKKLDELGVSYKESDNAKTLAGLLSKALDEKKDNNADKDTTPSNEGSKEKSDVQDDDTEDEDENDSGEAKVYSGPKVIRVYTEESHGKDYKKLAKEFASKKGYTVK